MKKTIHFFIYLLCLTVIIPTQAQVSGNWKQVGPIVFPINVSGQIHGIGRTTQLKFHPSNPQKMYTTSATGGLYISNDGGNNWAVTGTDNLFRMNCASVCIDYTNDQILYLGTGDPNYYSTYSGVYKSTDGGVTWNPSNSGIGNRMALEILMSPLDHNVLIAATNDGIWKSTNGGSSWTVKKSGGAFKDMIFKPATNSSTIYAVNDTQFWLSNDMGETWTQITLPGSGLVNGGRLGVSKADANVVYVTFVGDFGANVSTPVLKSTNSGQSFTVVRAAGQPNLNGYSGTEGGQGNYNYSMTADPANANIVYIVGHVVWKSTNGGVSWSQLTNWYQKVHTDMHQIVISPYNGSHLWNVNDGGNWLSTDGGNNWTPKSNGLGCTEIYHASQSPVKKDLIDIGTQDNGELHFVNNTWYTNGGGDYGGITAFDHQNIQDVYHLNDGTRKRINGSGGAPGLSLPFTVNSEVTLATNPLQVNTGFICQTDIYRTTNLSGNPPSWTKISTINIQMKDLRSSPGDINLLYAVSNNGRFYRSDNATAGTPTFVTINTPAATNNNASIAPIKSNTNVVYLSCGSKVYRSADKGATWTDVSAGLPNVNIINLQHDPYSTDESIYVGMATGVYYKNNTMTGWLNYSKGLPTVATINEIMIYTDGTSNGEIRVGYYGRGVWGSGLYGSDNLPVVAITTPLDGAAYAPNSNISITATATGKAGATITKVEFYNGATLIGTATASPYTITWNNVATGNYQITAKATDSKGDVNTSAIVRIGVQNLRNPDSPANPQAGIDYKYYEGNWSAIPDFATLTPAETGISTTGFDISYRNRDDQFGFNFTGYIQVPVDGIYTFYTSTDDGSRLYIGTTLVVDNDGLHGNTELSGTIGLKAGRHAITVNYFENGADEVCDASYAGPGITKKIIPASVLFRSTTVNANPTVSITAPANNASFFSGNNIAFTVNAADSDGTISKVEYYNGTTLIGTSTTSPFSVSWNNVAAGNYTITAKATDNAGGTGTSTGTAISVIQLRTPENPSGTVAGIDFKYYEGTWNALPDFASLTPVKSGISTTAIDLSYRNRDDMFGFSYTGYISIATDGIYTFYTSSDDGSRLYIGTTLVVDNDGLHGTQERTGTIGLKAGRHAITVTFFEQGGGQVLTASYSGPSITKQLIPANTLFRINTVNNAPTVSITAPANNANYNAPANITITATATDTDGSISKVEFFNGAVSIGSVTASPYTVNWNAVSAGAYSITAKATDNQGAVTTSSAISVIVNAGCTPTPIVPYLSINGGAWVNTNTASVTTGGNVTLGPQPTDVTGWSWTGPNSFTSASREVILNNIQLNQAGNYVATFTNAGGCSSTATFVVTVSNPNALPTVSITAPVNNANYTAPASITINANATDSDGTISKVEFFNGTTLLGTDNSTPYSYNWTNVIAGTYTLTAKATDNVNGATTSSAITVVVKAPNQAPAVSITSPSNNASFNAPATITITASATDNDGSISKVEFFNGTTSLGNVTISPYSYNWNNIPAGSYTLTARATDNSGAITASSAVVVNVTAGNACSGIATYVEAGGYAAANRVQNAGSIYECRSWPNSGWCNGAAWAYAPGTGAHWGDAWTLVGSCTPKMASNTSNISATTSLQSAPNPFENRTTLSFDLVQSGNVTVAIYNEYGTLIEELFNGTMNAGSHSLEFNLDDLPAGRYICRLISPEKMETMSLIKVARPKKAF